MSDREQITTHPIQAPPRDRLTLSVESSREGPSTVKSFFCCTVPAACTCFAEDE